ncbi:dipeptide/oligopeptide/nickel ABC transporter ATP-binding protein [Candidatus Bathyarchaeota archaeon RBG_16_57_9]|nr:MAG: dipeptide/oligopeptide/nickel ABC transporter ATP-binding protein [Candidatus Bathyarchaeota archaeon RBG_16_57_9]OGD54446.1 MAG: dipeptide/oligopeptide/nickel ABC transporter ATP-binding protein [Candidatus Bathyarchaeota archaeon RBG_13_60_20]
MTALLEVRGLKMHYGTVKGDVKAVDDVSFSLEAGESLGIAGESGCGKTSVALALMKLQPGNAKFLGGSITLDGMNVLALDDEKIRREVRWKRISMVPQAAMNALNPVFTVKDQIIEAILTHEDVSEKEAEKRTLELLKRVGIDPSRAGNYPHEFSGGMKQRAMIAMALACNPEIVIADEPTTALDVIVQAQVLKVIKTLQRDLGLSMILISHDLSVVAETCERTVIMYAGSIVENTSTVEMFRHPLHPYSVGLIGAFPKLTGERKRLESITGNPPNLLDPPPGCRFHPRCPHARDVCTRIVPPLLETHENHMVACHMVNRHPEYR